MRTVNDIEKARVKVNKAYLVSCVNSRVEDLAQAAAVIRGKHVAPHVQFYVAAASSEVQQLSEERGDWGALLAAGARPLPAGCGPCVGAPPARPPPALSCYSLTRLTARAYMRGVARARYGAAGGRRGRDLGHEPQL